MFRGEYGRREQKAADKKAMADAQRSTVITAVTTLATFGAGAALGAIGNAGAALANSANGLVQMVGQGLQAVGSMSATAFSTVVKTAVQTIDGSRNGLQGALAGFANGVLGGMTSGIKMPAGLPLVKDLPVGLGVNYDPKNGWGGTIGVGGNEGMSGSVTFSQRGGAQAELSRDGASLSYNGADGSFGAGYNVSLNTFKGMFSDANGIPSEKFKELSKSAWSGLSAGLNYNSIAGFSGSVNYSYPTDRPDENAPRQRAYQKDRTGVSAGLSITDRLGTSLSLGRNSAQGFETDSMSWSAGNLAVAQDDFDDLMYDRTQKSLKEYLEKNKNKLTAEDELKLTGEDGKFDPSRLSEKDKDEMFKRLGLQNGPAENKMWRTSFGDGILGAADSFLSGIGNDFTNMFTAGSGRITSSAGMMSLLRNSSINKN